MTPEVKDQHEPSQTPGLFACSGFGKQLWLLYKFPCAHIGANVNEGGRGANTAALLPPTCLANTTGRGGVGGGGGGGLMYNTAHMLLHYRFLHGIRHSLGLAVHH